MLTNKPLTVKLSNVNQNKYYITQLEPILHNLEAHLSKEAFISLFQFILLTWECIQFATV